MDDGRLDAELESLGNHLVSLSARVHPDPSHHMRLRQELLRRHQERRTDSTQRAVRTLWPRMSRFKRLTLVAPPALATAVALLLIVWGLQISGHPASPSAEAARINRALSGSVPSVSAWQITVQQRRGDTAASAQCRVLLGHNQRLFMREGRSYLFSNGRWYGVTATLHGRTPDCPAALDLQWATALLPAHLQERGFVVLPDRTVAGRHTVGIRYTVHQGSGAVTSTVWADRSSGLVLHAERVAMAGNHVTERDTADYSYTRSR